MRREIDREVAMDGLRRHLTYSNVMVTILAFVVLGGGTAVALEGANTVFSDDIVNGEVQTADIADAAVIARKIAPGSVSSPKVLDDSLNPADIRDIGFLRAKTAELASNEGEQLFTVGRVRLGTGCSTSGGTTTGFLSPTVDETGPIMVTETDVVPLAPFDFQTVVIVGDDTAVDAAQTSFALLDRDGTSVTGVAAATVDPETDSCVISVHAVG
jgi:hypothetical protein